MTGRGIDQILPVPSNPVLYESFVTDAREYVELAEAAHGPVPRQVDLDYIWGDALAEMRVADLRIINLETAITSSEDAWPGKAVHYRMNPANIACLKSARVDCCSLANNHCLDWGYPGLFETLDALDAAGIPHAGAGRNIAEAAAPAVLDAPGGGRVLVFAYGSPTSGVPAEWSAREARAGVNFLEDLSNEAAAGVAENIAQIKQSGDIVIVSIHWGDNWGYEIPTEQTDFAHALIAGGADVVHGHSSHHVKALEVHRGRLILYGCGDFLTDYEGITGFEQFRGDLSVLYLPTLAQDGRLLDLRMIPMQMRQFRLNRAGNSDVRWLCDVLNKQSEPFGVRFDIAGEAITLQRGSAF